MSDLPAPLVSAEIDLTGFSSFMLDVDRLLTSELVAIGTPEECWAAHLLMCRAWKQSPHGSLPDDPRVLAAFSGAGKRWPAVAPVALREFVKCSDGRWYHPLLASEAAKAWKRRQQYEADQERLRRWRETKRGNGPGKRSETGDETRFNTVSETVREPERQDRDRTGQNIESPGAPSEPQPPKGRKARRPKPEGELCPEEFRPKPSHYAKAAEWGQSAAWVDHQAEMMAGWSRANANNPSAWKSDWAQALHVWMGKHREVRPPPAPPRAPTNGAAVGRSTSGPSSARAGISAALGLHRGEPH